LRENGARTVFAHVAPPEDLNAERMKKRRGHFMNPSLLSNQYATLERLEDDELGFVVDNPGTPEEVFVEVYTRLADL
jgi:shikimate kinase